MKEVALGSRPLTLGIGISLHCCQESGPRAEAEPAITARQMRKEGDNLTRENGV